jgi:hypothetical protein
VAGTLGIAVARLSLSPLLGLIPSSVPRLHEVALDLRVGAVVSMWARLPASVTTERSVGRARTLASAPAVRVRIRFFSVVVEPPLAVTALSGRIGSRVQRRNGVSCRVAREPCSSMRNSTWSETSGNSDGLPMISLMSSSPMENGLSCRRAHVHDGGAAAQLDGVAFRARPQSVESCNALMSVLRRRRFEHASQAAAHSRDRGRSGMLAQYSAHQ